MDCLQEIEGLDGLHRIEKVKIYKEIIPLETSFLVKNNKQVVVERKKDDGIKGLM